MMNVSGRTKLQISRIHLQRTLTSPLRIRFASRLISSKQPKLQVTSPDSSGLFHMKIMQTLLDLSVGKICCSRLFDGTYIFGRIDYYNDCSSTLRTVVVVKWDDNHTQGFYIESFRTYSGKISETSAVYIITEKDKLALQLKH